MAMTDREKVLKGLVCCMEPAAMGHCQDCPYVGFYRNGNINNCTTMLSADALALLNEQERKIVELEQLMEYERNVMKAHGRNKKA